MKKLKKIVLLLFMTTLANSILFAAIPVLGPNVQESLELYSVWNPNDAPYFALSTNGQYLDYSQSTIQYETSDFDLKYPSQTEDFIIHVYSNYSDDYYWWNSISSYSLDIYFSENFVPVSDQEYYLDNYPEISLNFNQTLNTDLFYINWWGNRRRTYSYISSNLKNQLSNINYGSRNVYARRYNYIIRIPEGTTNLDLINFNFSWDGYTQPLDKYWDMEAYVKVDITAF